MPPTPSAPRPLPSAPADVRLVPDGAYADEALGMARRAVERVWCSVFIVDLASAGDPSLRVFRILQELAAARWRGVDVRLLLGGSRTTFDIAAATASAWAVAHRTGVPTRWATRFDRRGSHVKCVLADDEVLTGSHNWSPGALGGHIQDSVWLASPELAAVLADEFLAQWGRSRDRPARA